LLAACRRRGDEAYVWKPRPQVPGYVKMPGRPKKMIGKERRQRNLRGRK
jgi:hypothetical protein